MAHTYLHKTTRGKVVMVTIPENENVEHEPTMASVLKDNLSPEAVALLAVYTQRGLRNRVGEPNEVRQIEWFMGELVKALGGSTAFGNLLDEMNISELHR